jgi:hypothetical protein
MKKRFIEVPVGDEARNMIFDVALRKDGVVRDMFKTTPLELAKAVEIFGYEAMQNAKKAKFWKSAAFGSFAAALWISMRYAKKLSELELENEVLRDALPEEVDDGHDEA